MADKKGFDFSVVFALILCSANLMCLVMYRPIFDVATT